jgi:hypothetical protein
MGLNKDLKLKGNDFSNASTAFFIAYLIAEVPNGELHKSSCKQSLTEQFRIYSPENPSREMARLQRRNLGYRYRQHRRNNILPFTPYREDLPRNVRGNRCSLSHAHQ